MCKLGPEAEIGKSELVDSHRILVFFSIVRKLINSESARESIITPESMQINNPGPDFLKVPITFGTDQYFLKSQKV